MTDIPSAPESAFGAVLRDLRRKRGVSQEDFAFECGLNRQFISLLELGQRAPGIETIYKLAKGLGMTGSQLLAAVEDSAAKHDQRTMHRRSTRKS